jgi:hypothetical protein
VNQVAREAPRGSHERAGASHSVTQHTIAEDDVSQTLSVTNDMQHYIVEPSVGVSPVLARPRSVHARVEPSLVPLGDGFTLARGR